MGKNHLPGSVIRDARIAAGLTQGDVPEAPVRLIQQERRVPRPRPPFLTPFRVEHEARVEMTDWSVLLEEGRKQEKAAAREAKEQRLPEDVVAMLEDPSRPRATNSQTFYRLAEFIMGRSELTAEGHRIADEEGALGRVIESEALPVPDACPQYKHSVRIFAEHTAGGFWRGGKNRSHHDYDADADRWIAHQPQSVREACQALGPLTRRDCELSQRRGAVWQLLYDWLDAERGADQRAAEREAEVSRDQELAAALPAPGGGDGAV